MIIKPKLYDLKQNQVSVQEMPEMPLILRNPTKTFVLFAQIILMVLQIEQMLTGKFVPVPTLRIVLLFLSIITFIGYLNDYTFIMKCHLYTFILWAAIPLALVEVLLGVLIGKFVFRMQDVEFNGSAPIALYAILVLSIYLAALAFYLKLCYELIKGLDKKNKVILPYFAQDSNCLLLNDSKKPAI